MRWYVARVDGVVAASLAVCDGDAAGLINNVATVPRFRARGLAGALVAQAQREAPGPLLLEVEEDTAERVYRRAGFEVRGELRSAMYWLEPSAAVDTIGVP